MPLRIAVIAEAHYDFRVVSTLFDRAALESKDMPEWIRDDPQQFEVERVFSGINEAEEFTVRKSVKSRSKNFGKGFQNVSKFGTGLGDDLRDTERCVSLAVLADQKLNILLLSRDSDGKSERLESWRKVKEKFQNEISFQIVLASQHCKLEAWILNGFVPNNSKEEQRLKEMRQELGFPPVEQAEKLWAGRGAKKCPKRVLSLLCDKDREREERCWNETDLKILRENGTNTGLSAFLEDVENSCVPMFSMD